MNESAASVLINSDSVVLHLVPDVVKESKNEFYPKTEYLSRQFIMGNIDLTIILYIPEWRMCAFSDKKTKRIAINFKTFAVNWPSKYIQS